MLDRITRSAGVNRQVLALSVARLGDAIGNSILFVIIPLYVAKLPSPVLGLPVATRVGLALSLYGLVAALGQPLAGAIADRIGRRKPLILAGLLLMAACTLGFTVAGAYGNLLWLRALQGLAVAFTIPTSLAIMSNATEKRTRGGSMGVYTTMRVIGLASGPLLAGALYEGVGFDAAFYLGAGCVLLGAVLVQAWVHDEPTDTSQARARPFRLFEPGLVTPAMLGLGGATFTMAASFSMMGALENEFNARLDQSVLAFGVAFSALMLSRLLLQFPVGRWSDRAGRKPFLVAGLILMAPATALLGFAATTGQLVLLRVGQGVASAGVAAPAFALAADMARRGGEGRQMSIVTTGFGFGLSFGPLLAGVLAVAHFALPFIVGGVLSLVGAVIVLRVVPESVRRSPRPSAP
ncbi:MAG TPA: MFS transporter [Trueperaceae bacterium]|nr:MFS transporter [Trueperaceae bacterium]